MSLIIFDGGLHEKDPSDVLLYQFDFNFFETLGEGVEIASAVFTITGDDAVLTKDNENSQDQYAYVRLSGGTVGVTYTITIHIVTNEAPSQELDRSFSVYVMER